MRIIVETRYGRYTHECDNDDADIFEMMGYFKDMGLAMGYAESSWNNAICAAYDDLPEDANEI